MTEQHLPAPVNHGRQVPVGLESEQQLSGIMERLTKINQISMRHTLHLSGGHSRSIMAILPVPGQARFLTGSEDCTIRMWDEENQTALQVYLGHSQGVRGLVMRPGQEQFLSVGMDGLAMLWDLNDTVLVRKFSGHTGRIRQAAFFPDGGRFVTVAADQEVRLWDAASGACLAARPDHRAEVRAVVISRDGEAVYTGDNQGTIIKWNQDLTTILWRFSDPGNEILSLYLDSRETCLLAGTGRGELLLVGREDYALIHRWKISHDALVKLCPAAGEGRLYAGSSDGFVYLLDGQARIVLFTYAGPTYAAGSMAWLGEGELFFTCSNTAVVYSLDHGNGKKIFCHERPEYQNFNISGKVSPDRKWLATASSDSSVMLFDFQTGERLALFTVSRKDPLGFDGVTFSHDSRYVVGAFNTCWVFIWEVATREMILELKAHPDAVRGAVLTADNRYLVTVGRGGDDNIKVWSADGKFIQKLSGHTNTVFGVAMSPDGKTMATVSGDCTARLWSTETFACSQVLDGHGHWLMSVVFSGDGQRVAAVSDVDKVLVWDVASGNEAACISLDGVMLASIALNHDGSRLVIGTKKEGAKIMALPGQEITHQIRGNFHRYYDTTLNWDHTRLLTTAYTQVLSWGLDSGLDCMAYGATQRVVTSLCLDDAHDRLFVAAQYMGCKALAMGSGQMLMHLPKGLSSITGMVVRRAGRQLIVADNVNLIQGVEIANQQRDLFLASQQPLSALAYARGAQRLFSGDERGNIVEWSAEQHRKKMAYRTAERKIIGLALDPQETRLAAIDEEGNGYAVDLRRNRLGRHFQTPSKKASAAAMQGEWEKLIVGDQEGNLWFYHPEKDLLYAQHRLPAGVSALLTVPDMPYLVVGLENGALLLLDEQGEAVKSLAAQPTGQKIKALAYSLKHGLIVSGGEDGIVKFWHLDEGLLLGSYYCLESGFLWTTPGDALAPQGWFFTQKPELINLIECDEDGKNCRPATHETEKRLYFSMYHRPDQVMKRIFNYAAYQRELRAAGQTKLKAANSVPLLDEK